MKALRETWLLITRNLRVLVADRFSTLWALGQVPLMGILIVACFHGFQGGDSELDYFSRYASNLQRHVDGPGGPRVDSEVAARLYRDSAAAQERIGAGTAQRRAAVSYLLVSAAMWFGLMNACKEIVSEQHVLQQESRSCYRLTPYLVAKVAVLSVLVGLQTTLLGLITIPVLLSPGAMSTLGMLGVLWLSGIVAVCLGLLVSAGCGTVRLSLTWVPILMVPQFLFGGLLRPLPMASVRQAPADIGVRPYDRLVSTRDFLACMTIQRWGFEGLLALDAPFKARNVVKLSFNYPEAKEFDSLAIVRQLPTFVGADETSIAGVMLPAKTVLDPMFGISSEGAQDSGDRLWRSNLALAGGAILLLGVTRGLLQRRFT